MGGGSGCAAIADSYATLRHNLDKGGYPDILPLEALPLVSKLFSNLSQSQAKFDKSAKECEQYKELSTKLQGELGPFQRENVSLLKETSQLRMFCVQLQERHDEEINEARRRVEELEEEKNDLKNLVRKLHYAFGESREMHCNGGRRNSSSSSYYKPQQPQPTHQHQPHCHCPKDKENQRRQFPPCPRHHQHERDRIRNGTGHAGDEVQDQKALDYFKITDARIEALQLQIRALKDTEKEAGEALTSMRSKVVSRDKEIEKLRQCIQAHGHPAQDKNLEAEAALKAAQLQLDLLQRRNLCMEKKLRSGLLNGHDGLLGNEAAERELLGVFDGAYPTHDEIKLCEKLKMLEAQLSSCCKEKAELKAQLERCEAEKQQHHQAHVPDGGYHLDGRGKGGKGAHHQHHIEHQDRGAESTGEEEEQHRHHEGQLHHDENDKELKQSKQERQELTQGNVKEHQQLKRITLPQQQRQPKKERPLQHDRVVEEEEVEEVVPEQRESSRSKGKKEEEFRKGPQRHPAPAPKAHPTTNVSREQERHSVQESKGGSQPRKPEGRDKETRQRLQEDKIRTTQRQRKEEKSPSKRGEHLNQDKTSRNKEKLDYPDSQQPQGFKDATDESGEVEEHSSGRQRPQQETHTQQTCLEPPQSHTHNKPPHTQTPFAPKPTDPGHPHSRQYHYEREPGLQTAKEPKTAKPQEPQGTRGEHPPTPTTRAHPAQPPPPHPKSRPPSPELTNLQRQNEALRAELEKCEERLKSAEIARERRREQAAQDGQRDVASSGMRQERFRSRIHSDPEEDEEEEEEKGSRKERRVSEGWKYVLGSWRHETEEEPPPPATKGMMNYDRLRRMAEEGAAAAAAADIEPVGQFVVDAGRAVNDQGPSSGLREGGGGRSGAQRYAPTNYPYPESPPQPPPEVAHHPTSKYIPTFSSLHADGAYTKPPSSPAPPPQNEHLPKQRSWDWERPKDYLVQSNRNSIPSPPPLPTTTLQQLQTLEETNAQLLATLARKDEKLSRLIQECEAQQREILQLKNSNRNVEQRLSSSSSQEILLLRRQLDSVRTELEICRRERDEAISDNRKLAAFLTEEENERSRVVLELDRKSREAEDLRRQVGRYIEEVRRIEEVLLSKEEEMEALIASIGEPK